MGWILSIRKMRCSRGRGLDESSGVSRAKEGKISLVMRLMGSPEGSGTPVNDSLQTGGLEDAQGNTILSPGRDISIRERTELPAALNIIDDLAKGVPEGGVVSELIEEQLSTRAQGRESTESTAAVNQEMNVEHGNSSRRLWRELDPNFGIQVSFGIVTQSPRPSQAVTSLLFAPHHLLSQPTELRRDETGIGNKLQPAGETLPWTVLSVNTAKYSAVPNYFEINLRRVFQIFKDSGDMLVKNILDVKSPTSGAFEMQASSELDSADLLIAGCLESKCCCYLNV
ncbi:hypothetical protein B0H16DRAFT_1698127 [Mycena metata]|uniref:Uncharacterized protein n=1 Tax=Mycena metata TaxID=1033252 RepID=A0AAD7MPF2_9AGAR|nr:hypothetical protein B0H16DRAFT_1698127 [Mycena metata]